MQHTAGIPTAEMRLVLCSTPRERDVLPQTYFLIPGLKSCLITSFHTSGSDRVRLSPFGLYCALSNWRAGRREIILESGILPSVLLPPWRPRLQREHQVGACPGAIASRLALLGSLVDSCSCSGLLASVSKHAARASQPPISPVKYCDSLVNSTARHVGNTGGAKPTSNYLICNCLFLYVQKLEKF